MRGEMPEKHNNRQTLNKHANTCVERLLLPGGAKAVSALICIMHDRRAAIFGGRPSFSLFFTPNAKHFKRTVSESFAVFHR